MKTPPPWLPGEPETAPPSLLFVLGSLLRRVLLLVLAVAAATPLWPLYALARLRWERPPTLPSVSACLQHLRWVLEARPQPPLPAPARLGLLLELLTRLALRPAHGLAWLLDEALYGAELDARGLGEPVFVLSAARSGSTHLGRVLAQDPAHLAPNMLQIHYPWLWLWRLAARFSGFVPRERVQALIEAKVPEEFQRRHHVDPFLTDTVEVLFGLCHHVDLLRCLGPGPYAEAFSHSQRTGLNRAFWDDTDRFIERLGRKTLLFDGGARRLLVKGHFLALAQPLAERYPQAAFIAVLRPPAQRLQSFLNFLRANPSEELLGPVPWPWIVRFGVEEELRYCEAERAWYGAQGPGRRFGLPFQLYVEQPDLALEALYREALGRAEGPPEGLDTGRRPSRGPYGFDRSLEQLGVEVERIHEQTADYTAWIEDGPSRRAGAAV